MEYQIEREGKEILGDFKPELIPDECGGGIDDYEEALHVLMKFVGSMSSALEQVSGRGANAIVYQAGKRMGHEAGKMVEKTDNLEKAMQELSEILGVEFYFEMWKPTDQTNYTLKRVMKLLSNSYSEIVWLDRHSEEQDCHKKDLYVICCMVTLLGLLKRLWGLKENLT